MLPGHPRMQHKQDTLQRQPVRQALPTRIAKAPPLHRQKRLDQLPQLVRDDPRRSGHRHPSQLDDECRRHSSSASGSLHYERSSKSVPRFVCLGRRVVRPVPLTARSSVVLVALLSAGPLLRTARSASSSLAGVQGARDRRPSASARRASSTDASPAADDD